MLVPLDDLLRLRREAGCEEVPTRLALRLFDTMAPLPGSAIRRFAVEARLRGFLLGDVDDEELRHQVRHAIERRLLVAVRKSARDGQAADASVHQRRLVRRIAQHTRGRIDVAGRRYRLVADVDLGGVANRSDYQVVAREEAGRVLDALARQPGTNPELTALLTEAQAMLAADWRPPAHPEGLILLRRIPVVASVPVSSVPALTPSQLQEQFAEQVDPMIEGAPVELDLSVVELPAESDAADVPDGKVAEDSSESDEAVSGALEDPDQGGQISAKNPDDAA